MEENKKYTVGSLYAGVGGICLGFKNAGFELNWANEFDKNACITYRHNFDHKLYEEDVLKLDPKELAPIDILTGGFPCQPFSVAGYRKGFNDDRGNHFFRILEYIDELNPKVVFLENVKNLTSHDKGNTYKVIIDALTQKNYKVFSKVLNTKDYGNVPHNRERIFIVCFRNDIIGDKIFKFPKPEKLNKTVKDIIDNEQVDEKFYYRENKYMYNELVNNMFNDNTVYQWRRQYVRENKSNVCPTLTANMGTGGHNVPLVKTDFGIRKLTPKECFEFQGFPVSEGNFSLPNLSISHLYKQAGNSVSVPVIQRLAVNILKTLNNDLEYFEENEQLEMFA
jgi:DNA (cytosine-5)-methyltransferase 1